MKAILEIAIHDTWRDYVWKTIKTYKEEQQIILVFRIIITNIR